jgi:sensor histidine kinase YesM
VRSAGVDYRLRRMFGGGLRIESAPGQGTTVSFVLNGPP